MKKAYAMIVLAAFLAGLLSIGASAVPAIGLEIPKAQSEPACDGSFDAAEWANAWHVEMNTSDPGYVRTAGGLETAYVMDFDFYMMWDPENLYIAVLCDGDKTPTPKKMESGMDTRDNTIRGDGFQLLINPTGIQDKLGVDTDTTYGSGFLWTDFYCEYAQGVNPFTWAYAPYDGDSIDAMPAGALGYTIGSKRDGTKWVIEIKAPWKVLNADCSGGYNEWDLKIPRVTGDKISFEFNTLDFDGTGQQARFGMTPDGNWTEYNCNTFKVYTLVDSPAGIAPVADTPAPAQEGTSAPKTFDGIYIFVLAGAGAAATLLFVRKLHRVR
ncbi:MAG: hypothetical protein PHS07_04190 [Patescibacteria group bacterium]|nr:hypothetical protein [Patescibacteria group bacterium]